MLSIGEWHSNARDDLDLSHSTHNMQMLKTLVTLVKFLFLLVLVISGVHSCIANQDLKSLDDEELNDFVLKSETGAFKERPR